MLVEPLAQLIEYRPTLGLTAYALDLRRPVLVGLLDPIEVPNVLEGLSRQGPLPAQASGGLDDRIVVRRACAQQPSTTTVSRAAISL